MNCDYSNTTTAITFPISYDTWHEGDRYNITWDSNLPVFSLPDYSRGVDLEIVKHNRRVNTYQWVHTYQNINISKSYMTVNLKDGTWQVPSPDNNHTDFLYRLTMVPYNVKEGETDSRDVSKIHCINPVSVHIIPAVWLSGSSPTIDVSHDTPFDIGDLLFPGSGASKNKLKPIYYIAIAVFFALTLVAH